MKTCFSILVGCEAGRDIVAMVTAERVMGHVAWEALLWKGPVVWMEMRGSCADVAGVIEAQIRNRINEQQVRPRRPASRKLVAAYGTG